MDRKALTVTEIAVKGEDGHVVLDRGEITTLLKEGNVGAMFKYALHERSLPESIGEPERVFNVGEQGGVLLDTRPKAESVISSSSPDRDKDVMWQSGLVITDNYERNPTVFGQHNHDIPVGFTEVIKQYKNLTWAQWQWLNDVAQSLGKDYYEMWIKHVLNCCSVGFMINDWAPLDKGDMWGGWDIKEWELLEHSPVGLPSNRESMRTDGLKSMFRAYAEQVYAGPSPILKQMFEDAEGAGRPLQVPVSFNLATEEVFSKAVVSVVKQALAEGKDPTVEMTCSTKVEGDKALETFEEIRMAAAAGVLPVDKAFEMIGDLVDGYKAVIVEKDAAATTAEGQIQDLKHELVTLSAGVVEKFG